MEKVIIAQPWQQVFEEHGLSTFDDFYNFADGQPIHTNPKRNVQFFTLGNGQNQKMLFMKRFCHPHFKDMIFTLSNFGRLLSQAECEWENANLLLNNGIAAYKPACFGQKTICKIELKSFFITEKLPGRCLTDFIADNWLRLDQPEKEKIIVSLGRLIRKAHDANISLPDLYVWHIFIDEKPDGNYDFAVIDLHRMAHNVTSENQKLENLGRFTHSMTEKYFDDDLRELFIRSYADDNWPNGLDKLIAKVKRFSAKVSVKRNPKMY